MRVDFKCPECGHPQLEEIMVEVTVASTVKDIVVEDGIANFEYDRQTNEDGEIERFQCVSCGHVLLDVDGEVVKDLEALAVYLLDHVQPLEWNELWAAMKENLSTDNWVKTTEAMYHDQLGAVPPTLMGRGSFLCGEPWSFRGNDSLYAAFRVKDGVYEARYMTTDEFSEEFM